MSDQEPYDALDAKVEELLVGVQHFTNTTSITLPKEFPEQGWEAELQIVRYSARQLLVRMRAKLLSSNVWSEEKVEHVPDGPWQRFRKEHFPEAWLRLFPVKTREHRRAYGVWHVCPHEDLPTRNTGGSAHIRFVASKKAMQ